MTASSAKAPPQRKTFRARCRGARLFSVFRGLSASMSRLAAIRTVRANKFRRGIPKEWRTKVSLITDFIARRRRPRVEEAVVGMVRRRSRGRKQTCKSVLVHGQPRGSPSYISRVRRSDDPSRCPLVHSLCCSSQAAPQRVDDCQTVTAGTGRRVLRRERAGRARRRSADRHDRFDAWLDYLRTSGSPGGGARRAEDWRPRDADRREDHLARRIDPLCRVDRQRAGCRQLCGDRGSGLRRRAADALVACGFRDLHHRRGRVYGDAAKRVVRGSVVIRASGLRGPFHRRASFVSRRQPAFLSSRDLRYARLRGRKRPRRCDRRKRARSGRRVNREV